MAGNWKEAQATMRMVIGHLRRPGAGGKPPMMPSTGPEAEEVDAILTADKPNFRRLDEIISRYDHMLGDGWAG